MGKYGKDTRITYGWKDLELKSIHITLYVSSAKDIVNEWNQASFKKEKSLEVRKLIRLIEKHIKKVD